jgi:hypothetical protein
MALTLTPIILSEQNRVFPLTSESTGVTIRLATGSSGEIGTIKVEGFAPPIANLDWSIYQNPSWVTLEVDSSDPSLVHLRYTNATPNPQGLHQFFVSVNDGNSIIRYPIAIDVKKPFYLSVLSPRTDTIDLRAYDAGTAVTTIKAYGQSDREITSGDVCFLPPVLPDGLEFLTGLGNEAVIQVAQPSASDASGGVKVVTPYSQVIQVQAYQPGSMYDIPNDPVRTYTKNITLNVNTSLPGTFGSAVTCSYDDTNNYFVLKAVTSFALGEPKALTYAWSATGTGTGVMTGATTDTMHFAPNVASGAVTFHLDIKDANNGNVLLQHYDIGPMNVCNAGSDGATWEANNALKLWATAPVVSGAAGEPVSITIAGDPGVASVVVSFSVSGSGITAPGNITLLNGVPQTLILNVPGGATNKQKWTLTANGTSGSATGQARVVIESAGTPALLVSASNSSIVQDTGSLINPSIMTAAYPTLSTVIPGVDFYLVNAPAGLKLGQDGVITGGSLFNTVDDSAFSFKVMAVKPGYSPSYLNMTLDVTTSATPIEFSKFFSSVTNTTDNSPFTLSWRYPETTASLWLQKNVEAPVEVVSNASATVVGDSLFSLTGTNFYGTAYSTPLVVISDTAANLTKLPSAKTSAVIDMNNKMTIKWSPDPINNLYNLYKGWSITYKKNGGSVLALPNADTIITGLEDATGTLSTRVFSYQMGPDNIALSMKALSANRVAIGDSDAWSHLLDFPPVLTPTTFTLDKTTAKLGEPVTISMDSGYIGGSAWRVRYAEGKATEWLPTSLKTSTHVFTTPGPQTITIEIESDFSVEKPPVSLQRTMTLSLFVEDEQFLVSNANASVIGNIGIGGAEGFEVTDSSSGTYSREPYEVITRSIVKDEQTQEVKLLIATSRNNNASSALGTMALDVFPIQGRPHMKNLVLPALNLNGNTGLVSSVKIVSESLPDAVVGKPMPETQLQVSGGTAPYDWYSSNLPQGLVLNTDGTLSGTPMLMGVYTIDFSVKDSTSPAYIDSRTLVFSVKSDIAISEVSAPTAKVGTFYSHTIASLGGLAPFSWRLANGELPIGLSIEPSSGKILGLPCTYNSTTDFTKNFLFTPEVTDSIGAKASKQLYMSLAPADLTLGSMDQSIIYKDEDAKFAIPVYGGQSPYHLASFTSDGTIGSDLTLKTPEVINAVSELTPSLLVITTGDQIFNPQGTPVAGVYPTPYNVSFSVDVAGGVPGYRLSIDTSNPSLNTLPNADIIGNVVTGTVTADGHYTVNIKVVDSDGFGVSYSKVIRVTTNDNSTEAYSTTLEFVGVKKNGSNNTATWTFRKLSALPNILKDVPYKNLADTAEFYGLALWDNDLNQPAQALALPITAGKLSTSVQGGAEGQYAALGISAFTPSWTITTEGTGVFNVAGSLPIGYGTSGTASGPYAFFLFADSTAGAGIPVINQKISKVTDPTFGILSDYQIGTITLYSVTGDPLYSKSMFIYCSDSGDNTTSTPVVEVTSTRTQTIEGDIYDPLSATYNSSEARHFEYPLTAASGAAPYVFTVKDGSTLPGASIGVANGVPTLMVPSTSPIYTGTTSASYVAYVAATDKNGIVSQTATINVNYVPKTASTNPVQIVGVTYLQDIAVTDPTFRGYTGADLGVLDMMMWANQDVTWSLPPSEKADHESHGIVFITKPDNSFQIAGTPNVAQRYIFNVTATAVGAGSDTRVVYLDIVDPIVTIQGPTSPLTLNAKYNYATNHSVMKVSIEGYKVGTCPVVLVTNLGTLNPVPTNVNITSDMGMGHLGNPAYAQKWDAYYDFSTTVSGAGVLTTTGGVATTPYPFSAAATTLVAKGIVQPVVHVSEYATTFLPAPPLTITGGTAPYTYTVSSISNPTNFTISGGQLAMLMNSVSPTNQPGACDVTYTVTDSSTPTQTVVSTAGNVSVIVDAESYISAAFPTKEWVYTAGASTFPLYQVIQPKLGHKPYQWTITSVDFSAISGGMTGLVHKSSTNSILSINTSTSDYSIKDFTSTDVLYETTPGTWVATPTGLLYSHAWSSIVPTPGRYVIPIGVTITDAKGISVAGTTSVTLIVP